MVGNDDYNELLRVAASYKCNVILAGDEKQLASIGRGGMFEILADKYAGVNLLQIQRQDSRWGKSVAMDMSGGHVKEAVTTLEMHNKLYEQNNGPASMEQLLK